MRLTLLAALLLSSATALANPSDDLSAARQREQAASTRVSYYEMQTTIAERDVATARINNDTATKRRSAAIRDRDGDAASTWTRRQTEAVQDEREAQNRALQSRQERDRAYDDLQAAVTDIRRLERVARRARR